MESLLQSRKPTGPRRFSIEHRPLHDPEQVRREAPYSSVIRSDVTIVIEHVARLNPIAFPENP